MSNDESSTIERLRAAVTGELSEDVLALLPQLDGYVEAQLQNGADYQTQFADVALMLDQSVELSEAYARIYAAALAEREGVISAEIPQPDLSFLLPSLAARLQTALEQIGNTIRLRLDETLLPLLAPPPTLTPSLRAPDSTRYSEQLIELEAGVFTLGVWRDLAEPTQCLVEVTVTPPGKAWPDLADNTVSVTVGSFAQQEQTDAFGLTSFADVPVADLASLELAIELVVE